MSRVGNIDRMSREFYTSVINLPKTTATATNTTSESNNFNNRASVEFDKSVTPQLGSTETDEYYCKDCRTVVTAPECSNARHNVVDLEKGRSLLMEEYKEIMAPLEDWETISKQRNITRKKVAKTLKIQAQEVEDCVNRAVKQMIRQLEEMRLNITVSIHRKAQEVARSIWRPADLQHEVNALYQLQLLRQAVRGDSLKKLLAAQEGRRYHSRRAVDKLAKDEVVLSEKHAKSALPATQLLHRIEDLRKHVTASVEECTRLARSFRVATSLNLNAAAVLKEATTYSPHTNQCISAHEMTEKRCYAAAAGWHGKIVVAGGFPSFDSVEQYDQVSNNWTNLHRLLLGRSHHALVKFSNCIYAIGGNANGQVTSRAEMLSEPQGTWIEAPSLNTGRQGLVAVALEVSKSGNDRVFGIVELLLEFPSYD